MNFGEQIRENVGEKNREQFRGEFTFYDLENLPRGERIRCNTLCPTLSHYIPVRGREETSNVL